MSSIDIFGIMPFFRWTFPYSKNEMLCGWSQGQSGILRETNVRRSTVHHSCRPVP